MGGGELIRNNFADSKPSQSFFQKYKHTIERKKIHGEFETERPSVVHIAVCFKDSTALFSCFLKQKIKSDEGPKHGCEMHSDDDLWSKSSKPKSTMQSTLQHRLVEFFIFPFCTQTLRV